MRPSNSCVGTTLATRRACADDADLVATSRCRQDQRAEQPSPEARLSAAACAPGRRRLASAGGRGRRLGRSPRRLGVVGPPASAVHRRSSVSSGASAARDPSRVRPALAARRGSATSEPRSRSRSSRMARGARRSDRSGCGRQQFRDDGLQRRAGTRRAAPEDVASRISCSSRRVSRRLERLLRPRPSRRASRRGTRRPTADRRSPVSRHSGDRYARLPKSFRVTLRLSESVLAIAEVENLDPIWPT